MSSPASSPSFSSPSYPSFPTETQDANNEAKVTTTAAAAAAASGTTRATRNDSEDTGAAMETTTSSSSSSNMATSSLPTTTTTTLTRRATLVAKWGKERLELSDLDASRTTLGQVKEMLQWQTNVLAKRQKLIGLTLKEAKTSARKQPDDETVLDQLKEKKKKEEEDDDGMYLECIFMGTPEKVIMEVAEIRTDNEVIDDFDLEFTAGSEEWLRHVANGRLLREFTEKTSIVVMNAPREGKPLLVLDLDHTLMDFSSKRLTEEGDADMKRPYMDDFLVRVYRYFDICIWSQTSWRWLETKLTELGMLAHASYRFCFVLDKTSMFAVESPSQQKRHHVKPLDIIWCKFPQWSARNTIHVDDLGRNFALNPTCGLRVPPYHRRKRQDDVVLLGLALYLEQVATTLNDFTEVKFAEWVDVVEGKRELVPKRRGGGGGGGGGGGNDQKKPPSS